MVDSPSHAPDTRTVFLGQLFDDGSCVFEDVFPHASARRDAIVEHLLDNYPEADVGREEIEEILAPYGGADADNALSEVYDLFSDESVDMHLSEIEDPDRLPERLYAAFTDYRDGDGTTSLVVFPTAAERAQNLAERLENMSRHIEADASEGTLVEALTNELSPTGGTVYLEELDFVEGAWVSADRA